MEELCFYGYEFLSSFIPFLIVFIIFIYLSKKKGLSISKTSCVVMGIFMIYIICVYHVTGTGTLYDMLRLKIQLDSINLIPFSNEIDLIGYFLNIVLFIPLGFLVQLICKDMNKLKNIFGIGLGFSLLIELSQLLNYRATDIDDLILNTIGAIVGFALYKIFNKCTKSKYQLNEIPVTIIIVSILASFLGQFLLFNGLGLANLLY